jgi:hypothetical protein
MSNSNVAEKKENPVAEYDPTMFEEDQGIGSEGLGVDDVALPFLKALSRQDDILDDLPDAKAGDILNTATMEVFKGAEGVRVIPCVYQRRFIQWAPRGEGTGAPIAIFAPEDARPKTARDTKDNREYLVDQDGNQVDGTYIEETHQHFVLLLMPDGGVMSALVAMKSTQLKKSRKWNSMVSSRSMQGKNGAFVPPRFSHIYKLHTVAEENSKGSWHGWAIGLEGPITDGTLYKRAKDFASSVSKGEEVVKYEEENVDSPKSGPAGTPSFENDTPF